MTALVAGEPRGAEAWKSIVLHALVAVFLFLSGGFIVTAPLALFIPLVFISVALRHGERAAVLSAGLFVATFALLATIASQRQVTAQDASLLALVLASIVVPSVAAASLVRRGASFGSTVVTSLGGATAAFVAVEMLARIIARVSPFGIIVESFRRAGELTVDVYRNAGVDRQAVDGMARISGAITNEFLPLLLLSVAIASLASSIAAISRIPAGAPTAERFRFRYFALPDSLLFVFIAAGLSPIASGALRTAGLNVLGAIALLYVLQGIAILRFGLVRKGVGTLGTTLIFVLAAILGPYSASVFFLAGLFDPFFDFRKLNRKEESNESDLD